MFQNEQPERSEKSDKQTRKFVHTTPTTKFVAARPLQAGISAYTVTPKLSV